MNRTPEIGEPRVIRPVIVASEIPEIEVPHPETPFDNELELIEKLVGQAVLLCNNHSFRESDSIFRRVLSLLDEAGDQFSQDSVRDIDSYKSELVFIYSSMMPDSIAIPEEIAHQVFQQRMLSSLDSLHYSRRDSMAVAGLVNRSGVVYDVPVVWNNRVQKALFYYITRNGMTVERWRERSSNYLLFMKKMFVDSGLPGDLAYLPLIESGFNPKAYSRAHASGIWQFIRSTGKRYGLRANYWIDERRDPVSATEAAIRYLKKLHKDFGDWHLALAGYNCGEGGISRAMAQCGTNDYWQLRLPAETMNYVPLYLAAMTIVKNSDRFFAENPHGDTIPFDTVFVSDCFDLRETAQNLGIAYDTLRSLNPHILHWCTPPDMSDVRLYLPPGYAGRFRDYHAKLPEEKKARWHRYRIRPGDNLGAIARKFRIPVEGIQSVNRMRGTRIVAGKYLFIPLPAKAAYPQVSLEEQVESGDISDAAGDIPPDGRHIVYEVKPGDTLWRLGELFGVTPEQIRRWNRRASSRIDAGQILSIYTRNSVDAKGPGERTANGKQVAAMERYIVHRGDNVYRIARRFSVPVRDLCRINDLDPEKPVIHPGDTLRITGGRIQIAAKTSSAPLGCITYVVVQGDNLFGISRNFSVDVDRIRELNNLAQPVLIRPGDTLFIPYSPAGGKTAQTATEDVVYYKVKNGDNLWSIAHTFGIPVEKLYEYNGLRSTSVLMPGDTIRVLREREL